MTVIAGKELGELAAALAERRGQLREEIRAKLGEAADAYLGVDRQWSDAGGASAEAGLEFAEAAHDIAELDAIGLAEARIDEGRYGLCVQCSEPIPLPRLRAQPATLRCLACQEIFERKEQSAHA